MRQQRLRYPRLGKQEGGYTDKGVPKQEGIMLWCLISVARLATIWERWYWTRIHTSTGSHTDSRSGQASQQTRNAIPGKKATARGEAFAKVARWVSVGRAMTGSDYSCVESLRMRALYPSSSELVSFLNDSALHGNWTKLFEVAPC